MEIKVIDLQGPDMNVLCPLLFAREKLEDEGIGWETK